MIVVSNLHKKIAGRDVLRGLSFATGPGEILGLLGPNGSGKTTSLRVLAGATLPTAGTVAIAGYDLVKQRDKAVSYVGYLPENPPIFPELTVQEFLSYFAALRGFVGKNKKRAVERVIERCSLTSLRRQLLGGLSRGTVQRVGLAQALLSQPPVLILDEPTSALDPVQIHNFRSLMQELRADHTIILSSHLLTEVAVVATRIVVLIDGEIKLAGTIDEVATRGSLEEIYLKCVGGMH